LDVRTILGREPAMYIGGSWEGAEEKRPVINPADESVIAEVPEADAGQVGRALEAARTAQSAWARKTGPERGAVLRAVAEGIRARREELAHLVVAEQGKTITEARGEVGDAAAGFFDYYATFERAQVGTMFAPDEPNEHLLVRSVP
jgi:lactaldehyde dehydrogenase / glycolaldehyde dehydrogenase